MLYGRMVCISRLQISSPSRARKITTMVLGMSDIAAGVFSYTAHARVLNQRNWDSGLFNIKQQKHDLFNQLLLRS